MTIKERICAFASYKKITITKFQQTIGVSGAYVANISKGISVDVQSRIEKAYPDLNMAWLLEEKGEMVVHPTSESTLKVINVVPLSAHGGRLADYAGSAHTGCETIVSPTDCADVAVQMSDDSMEPAYIRGSRLLVKRIDQGAFIEWGAVYALDTINGVVVRKVYEDGNDAIRAVSCNENTYPTFYIKKSHITGWYKVIASINIY